MYLRNVLSDTAWYPLNRFESKSSVLSPLAANDCTNPLTYPLNLMMSLPMVTIYLSKLLSLVLMDCVVALVSRWLSLIMTYSSKFPDGIFVPCLFRTMYSFSQIWIFIFASFVREFSKHIYNIYESCAVLNSCPR